MLTRNGKDNKNPGISLTDKHTGMGGVGHVLHVNPLKNKKHE